MTRTCSRCETPDLDEACPVCTAEWENRRDAATMSPEERAAEFDSWGPVLEIDFEKLHQRIEELELARTDLLRHEILTGIRPSTEGILAKIPQHVDVIPIVIDDPNDDV